MYDIAKTGSDSEKKLNAYNFEMSSVFLGANLTFLENWNASLGLDFNRILMDQGVQDNPSSWSLGHMTDPSQWTESFVEWNPNWSLSRNLSLADKLGLSVSYTGGYHFTEADPSPTTGKINGGDKLDNALALSLMWSVTEKLLLMPSVRFSHSFYTQPQDSFVHRQDRSISPGITVIGTLTPRLSVRFSVTGEFRHSNSNPESNCISKLDAATGVSITLKF